jgi:hypothetical protein
MGWDILIAIGTGVLLAREALRLLPDVLRLLPRLAADRTLPRGVRVRLALLLAYLASPSTWCPTSSRWPATPTMRSSLPPCCGRWHAAQACRRLSAIGPVPATGSLLCAASPG